MDTKLMQILIGGVITLIIITLLSLFTGIIIYGVWNWIIAGIFNLSRITYWNSVLLGIAISIILSLFRPNNN